MATSLTTTPTVRAERSWSGPIAAILLVCLLTAIGAHGAGPEPLTTTASTAIPTANALVTTAGAAPGSVVGEGLTQALLTRYRDAFQPLLLSGTHLNAEGQLDGPDGPFYIYYTGATPDPSFLGPYAGLVGWTVRLERGVR